MKPKHMLVLFAAAMTALPTIAAETNTVSVTVWNGIFSRYVLEDQWVQYEHPVSQGAVRVTLNETPLKGAFAELWYSAPLDGTGFGSNTGSEFDPGVGWDGLLWKDAGIGGSFCYQIYDMMNSTIDGAEVGSIGKGDLHVFSGELNRAFQLGEKHTLTPFVRVKAVIPVEGEVPERGFLFFAGVRHGWKLMEKLELCHSFSLVKDDGLAGIQAGFLADYQLRLDWKPNERLTITPMSFRLAAPLTVNDRETSKIVGCAVSWSIW